MKFFLDTANLDEIREVRTHWQFYRDRRPEMYGQLSAMKG